MDIKNKKSKGHLINQKDEDIFLKKHVGLIHCENKLSLMQRKICNIFLFNALDQIQNKDIHEIPLRKLCSLIGYNSNDSKLIKSAIKSLISVVMEWNLLNDNKFLNESSIPEDMITWNASALLAGASIRSGIIEYSYSPQMKSVLASLDIYGRINLFVQAKFNSTYSLVLYENCVRFKNLRQTAWFSIDLFRSLMGVPEGKYTSFKEFKRNVINVAVSEVNKKSDIYIEPQFKKSGRTITAIQFVLLENESYKPTFKKTLRLDNTIAESQQQSIIIEIVIDEFKLNEKQAKELISKYPPDYLIEKINLVKGKKNIDHFGAYFLSAVKNDYKETKKVVAKEESRIVENSYRREAKDASEIEFLKNKYSSYKHNQYFGFIKQLSDNIQLDIKNKFEQYLQSNAQVYKLYKTKGFDSSFALHEYINFLDKHFSHVIGSYLTFDEYITSEEVEVI